MDGPEISTLTERLNALQPDDKARAVLKAAFETFLQFGVRRASMQDIADRAGMSRAALYLHYKNKDDIFRALMESYFAAAADVAADALARETDPVAALRAAFHAQAGEATDRMMDSPHVDEMLSAKHGTAHDVMAAGEARLAQVYIEWLSRGAKEGWLSAKAVGDNPAETGALILNSVFAIKNTGVDAAGYSVARERLAELFGRALRP
ncbi:MAG: helix-turn-helix domain-containing protein [Pseudomonadota bacterium]